MTFMLIQQHKDVQWSVVPLLTGTPAFPGEPGRPGSPGLPSMPGKP